MALDGMIFDLDGTLVDSNADHVEAWRLAFEQLNYRIASDRISVEIGKGGDKVVPHILGIEADEKDGDGLRAAQPREFKKIVDRQGLKVFPMARGLIEALAARGIRTCMATSSKREQLEVIECASGVPWREVFDEIVTASDVQSSKPSPDAISAALRKLKLSPAQCAMVGDTPYDAEAARRGGVVGLGVKCGGHDASTLLGAGARAVLEGPREILEQLDKVLRIASPGSLHLTREVLEQLMSEALKVAREGMMAGEAPIGAVLADGAGNVVARAYNELNGRKDATAHAEMVAFGRAAGRISPDARDLILVSTLEPCVMCLGAAMEAAVDTIIYGLRAPADGGTNRVRPPESPESQMPRIVGGVLADDCRGLFKQWLGRGIPNARQVQFVKQLLQLSRDDAAGQNGE